MENKRQQQEREQKDETHLFFSNRLEMSVGRIQAAGYIQDTLRLDN